MSAPSPDALRAALASRTVPDEDWRPRLLSCRDAKTPARLLELLSSERVSRVYDTLRAQLAELIDTRAPREKLTEPELLARADAFLDENPGYGTWVHYPWSGRLVRVLEEPDFRELRTSRNRNKITAEEQERLRAARVGVLGLSVGAATAITLAMEEVGGEFVLADFDRLSLSNMNRLRAGVHDVGVQKTVLTARAIVEMNPYARVRVFSDGVHDENIDAFLDDPRLDVLFEECDDLYLKLKIRERARELRIPVLMETSDRGLFDVERFDLEPERPILHGLAEVRAEALRGLSTEKKVPIVLRILGAESTSARMAASLVEINESLKGWPQLASAISLGAALNTDAGRRVLLGQLTESGRFHVDLEQHVRDGRAERLPPAADDEWLAERTTEPTLPRLQRVRGALSEDDVRALVAYAMLAPSGGNCQPWSFRYRRGTLTCVHDVERSRSFLDFEHTATYLAFGALAETVRIAAAEMGLEARVTPFPDERDPLRVCDIALSPSSETARDRHFAQLVSRVTNRQVGTREPMPASDVRLFEQLASSLRARLSLVTDDERLAAVGEVLGAGDRLRLLSPVMHREMMSELRWSRADVLRTRDGLDIRSLDLDDSDRAGLEVMASWQVMELVGRFGGGRGLAKLAKKSVAGASAVGLLSMPRARPLDFFHGGRVLQRVWLEASARGYALQPMTALLYMFARLVRGGGEGFRDDERAELTTLRARHEELFPEAGAGELMLFRVIRGGPPRVRSLRRRVHQVLRFER